MFEISLLALSFGGFIFVKLLGKMFAQQPIAVREIARTRRRR